jgi:hypothetical protein
LEFLPGNLSIGGSDGGGVFNHCWREAKTWSRVTVFLLVRVTLPSSMAAHMNCGRSLLLFVLDGYNSGGAPSHGKEEVTIILSHPVKRLAWAMPIFLAESGSCCHQRWGEKLLERE